MSITRNTEPVFQVTKYFKTTFLLLRIDWTYLLPWFKHRIGMLLWSDSKRMWRYSMIHGILCTSAGCGLFCSWVMVNSRLKHLLGGIVCLLQVNQREFIMKTFNFFNSSSLITKDFFPKQLGINWNYKYWNYSSPSYPFESFLETKALLYSLSKFRIIFACKKLSFMQNKWLCINDYAPPYISACFPSCSVSYLVVVLTPSCAGKGKKGSFKKVA